MDLFLVFIFAFLVGRCLNIITRKYFVLYPSVFLEIPFLEFLTILTFCLVFCHFQSWLYIFSGWVLSSILLLAAFSDGITGLIPNKLTHPSILLGLIFSLFTIGFIQSLFCFLLLGFIFCLLSMLTRYSIGGGDIRIVAAIGAFMGVSGLYVPLLAMFLAYPFIIFLAIKHRSFQGLSLRFGPFLSLAALLILLFSQDILRLFISVFH